MSPADVLNQAADLIEKRGWWDGSGATDGERVCALIALDLVTGDDMGGYTAACDVFRLHVGADAIDDWNDAQPDGATVCAALRECARSL